MHAAIKHVVSIKEMKESHYLIAGTHTPRNDHYIYSKTMIFWEDG
jgi:hypothetical protein